MSNVPKGQRIRCRDCRADFELGGRVSKTVRKAPYPGPRCASHHRQVVRARKANIHEKRVQATYGLEPGDYQRLYDFQGGRCAICRRATGSSRRLSVDHDHRSGRVRMLLCRPCNDMLGHGRDDPAFFERAADVLRAPPAARLGIVAVHADNREEML